MRIYLVRLATTGVGVLVTTGTVFRTSAFTSCRRSCIRGTAGIAACTSTAFTKKTTTPASASASPSPSSTSHSPWPYWSISCHLSRYRDGANIRRMSSIVESDDGKDDRDPCGLKVLNHSDLIKYYNETKRLLLLEGGDGDGGADNGSIEKTKSSSLSPLSPLSPLPLNPKRGGRSRSSNSNNNRSNNAFSLQHLEPRHRKSMMRCVLNNPNLHNSKSIVIASSKKESKVIISKADFQQHLRLVERRKRWNMTRRLLFGDSNVYVESDNSSMDEHWWEANVISEEEAPEFVRGVREYRSRHINNNTNTDDSATTVSNTANHTMKNKNIEEEDPKRFLSRLARGRTFKGNFRSLLEGYVTTIADNITDTDDDDDDAANANDDDATNRRRRCEDFLSLYDEIIGVVAAKTKTKSKMTGEDNKNELELLRLFIDELEKAANNNRNKISAVPAATAAESPLIADKEQINLLREICSLDIFASSTPTPSFSRNHLFHDVHFVDDGGISVGKRGERDLKIYLEEKIKENTQPCLLSSSTSMVLSPVWVRPKNKNRRNSKQKCRYVLEIPTATTTSKNNSIMSSGTTSEFDAMVVRVVGSNGCSYDHDSDNSDNDKNGEHQLPIMAIQEVWDAKATLDPSALIDVLDKKVASLQKILLDEDSHVVNVADLCYTCTDKHDDKAAAGANFVILPPPENENNQVDHEDATASTAPTVYRVGIDLIENDNNENTNDITDGAHARAHGGYSMFLPQIGVFASRMLSPRAAARRIQTIVYERLLETDIGTVKSVIILNSNNNENYNDDDDDGDHGHSDNGDENNDDHPRSNRRVRDEAVEIVERMIRLINTVRPIVVVGTLPSNG